MNFGNIVNYVEKTRLKSEFLGNTLVFFLKIRKRINKK